MDLHYLRTTLVALASFLFVTTSKGGLEEIENQYKATLELQVSNKHKAAVADLDAKYMAALDRVQKQSSASGKLEDALAIRSELERIKNHEPLPEQDRDVPAVLGKLRSTYREGFARIVAERDRSATPILKNFSVALSTHQTELTKAGKLDDALAVKEYLEGNLLDRLLGVRSRAAIVDRGMPPDLAKHLILYYPFDRQSVVEDMSGRQNDATATTIPYLVMTGVRGGAVDFSKAQEFLVSKKPLGISGNAPRTVCAWVKPYSFYNDGDAVIFSWGDDGRNGGRFTFAATFKTGNIGLHGCNRDMKFAPKLSIDEWAHLGVTYDSTDIRIYLNGEEVDRKPMALMTVDSPVAVGLANRQTKFYRKWNGLLDEFMVFDSALTSDGIRTVKKLTGKS